MYYFVLISHYAHPVWSPSPSTGEGRGEGLFSPSTGEMPFRAERVYSLIIVNCPFAFILMAYASRDSADCTSPHNPPLP